MENLLFSTRLIDLFMENGSETSKRADPTHSKCALCVLGLQNFRNNYFQMMMVQDLHFSSVY